MAELSMWNSLFVLFVYFLFPRAYLDVKELKEILHLDGSTHLNVFFANSSDEDLAGVATWPWDKEALTHLGKQINTHTCMHAHPHTYTYPSLAAKFVGGKWYWIWRAFLVIRSIIILHKEEAAVFTLCVFLKFSQVEWCWTLPSMAHLVTLTQWSMRLAIVLGSTTCFEVYQRLNRVMTRVWRLSPQWRPEICAQTPIPLPNTKAAMILNQATKPVAVSTSHTHRSTTTWVTQVRYLKVNYVKCCVLFLRGQIPNFWVGTWPNFPT